jgi:hypothetical protein
LLQPLHDRHRTNRNCFDRAPFYLRSACDFNRRRSTETTPTFAQKQQSFTARMLQGPDAAMIRMSIRVRHLSLIGTKRKWRNARSESVVEGKADLTIATADFRV